MHMEIRILNELWKPMDKKPTPTAIYAKELEILKLKGGMLKC